MTKGKASKLFKKRYIGKSRTRKNWFDMLMSLVSEKEVTEEKATYWYYHGTSPTTYFNGVNWVQSTKYH